MNEFERRVRALVMESFRDSSSPPSASALASALGASKANISSALRALADEHCLVLLPGSDVIWMAHPFSGIETDFVVETRDRRWFANCVWDGLSILALLGDGQLATHSPATGEALRFTVANGIVSGEGIVHFLVPARRFWDDIDFT